jgi:hypothetical protein
MKDITVKLWAGDRANVHHVTIECNGKYIDLVFSYETLVAVNDVVSVNNWSKTTGRLLNELEPYKNARVPHEEVLKAATQGLLEVVAAYNGD